MTSDEAGTVHPDRVREAMAPQADEVEDEAEILGWANRFALLGDPNRLRLLWGIHRAGEICVSDLAAGVGMSHTATSQALRLLRMQDWVTTRRDGRLVPLPPQRRHRARPAAPARRDPQRTPQPDLTTCQADSTPPRPAGGGQRRAVAEPRNRVRETKVREVAAAGPLRVAGR